MNVLIAASYKAPQGGNFIPSLLELSLLLREQNDDVFFIFPKSESADKESSWCNWIRSHGFTVYLIDKNAPTERLAEELLGIIQKHDIHILHTHFGIYNKVIHRFRRKLPVKILIHNHFGLAYNKKKAVKQILRNIALSVYYRFLGIHVAAVNKAVGDSFVFANSWYVPNGLSLMRNVQASKTREEVRAMWGIQDNEKACLVLGWSLDIKGLDIAVKAVAECRQHMPEVTLCIVGFGSTPNQTVLDYISKRTNIDPRSAWIHYWDDTEDIYSYHRAVDVYLSSSRTEGFPYGVLEAISQNTPVVLSDIKGTRWAYAYHHAFPYPVEDPSACAQCIEKALKAGRTVSNYETIMSQYDIKDWCRHTIHIYKKL